MCCIMLASICNVCASTRQLVNSQTSLLLPKPRQLALSEGSFATNRAVRLTDPTASTLLASLFIADDEAAATVTVSIVSASELGTFDYELRDFDNEGYKLNVTTDGITITAVTKTGVIRAAQTLMQLKAASDDGSVPCLDITDYPAFKLRGFMHDVGRSFISFDELKNEIDLLSRFKINVFHWHLTDNQGFRFESKLYPQLNATSSMTRFKGLYYTQAQCTELEAYAAERGITIIPEIDMPGHSAAFTTAMGFNMSSTDGRAVLKELLGELAAAFPLAPYIHMGADEAGTTAEFVNEMSQYIKEQLGRRCIVWNPISGVSISTSTLPYIDMTEMWSTSGRKISGIPNIDCRYNYINHFDVFADLVGIYKSNIYYADNGNSELAGAITAIWNDRMTPTETDIISQNSLYANALATAERGWIGGGSQYIETGGTTLPNSGDEYDEFADWERRFLHYKATWLSGEPIPYVKQTDVKWRITDAFPNGGTASETFPPETATDDILPDAFSYDGKTYATSIATGAGIYLRHTWGSTVPAFFTSPELNTTAYAWTYVYSPKEQTAGALIEFQNYGRSENDKAPDAGKWDRKGSRIWLNDSEIMPPTWSNSGKSIGSEVPLGNENFPARAPIVVQLHEGWNKVFIKLPYVNANGVRLNKWMFTFVLTDLAGRNALESIVYSPIKSLDAEAEGVVALIGEIKQYVNNVCGTAPGYYPTTTADGLMEMVAEAEATLSTVLTAEQRTQQKQDLQTAFNAFKASLTSQQLVMPKLTTDGESHCYSLCTPLRGTRYATSTGAASEVAGTSTPRATSYWKFVARTDGTMDIVNAADGTYLSPASTNNIVLYTQAAQPAKGWTLKAADEVGYMIITSTLNNCQINQTNMSSSALSGGYKVYNWGGGTNTTDTGCKYRIEEVEEEDLQPNHIVVYQGHQTTGQGNTMQALLRLKVTPFSSCTPTQVNIRLTGANLLDKVAVYSTTIDQLHATGANPQLLGQATPSEGEVGIPLTAPALIGGQTVYYWITADVKNTATELGTIDASLLSIDYSNASGNNTCDVSSTGNPDGVMTVYKRQQFLWTASQSLSKYYRIPTIIRTNDGGIIALTDDRYDNTQDLGKVASGAAGNHKVDVVVRKSMDDGVTWDNARVIAAGDGSSAAACGYGDPAVVRTNSGKLICLMAAGNKSFPAGMLHMGYSESTDNGQTWSVPKDIYSSIQKNGLNITSAFTSAGKGVTFSNGRVAFAMNATVSGTTNEYILYSDDEGATWTIAPNMACASADESKLEIMNDNSLLLSVRQGGWNSQANRAYNRTTGDASGDGINTWGTKSYWGDLNANGCNADILYYERGEAAGDKYDVMLHTVVKTFNTYRRDLRLFMSFNQGQTWVEAFQLQPGYSAYSSMQKLENGDLAIIFEDGSLGNQDKMDCYAINYIVLSAETLKARMDELYEAAHLPTANIITLGETNTSAPWGTWSPASGWAKSFTTNASSGFAGVKVSASHSALNREGDYGQRVMVIKPSAAGATDVITIEAPTGYVIKGYTIGGHYFTYSETYTLTSADGSQTAEVNTNSGTPNMLTVDNIYAPSTSFSIKSNGSTNNRYACIMKFTVTLADADANSITHTLNNSKPCHWFDLSGRHVSQPSRGMYISGGRKVVVR